MVSAAALSPDLLRPGATGPAAGSAATRERIAQTAQDFEAVFLSQMIGAMFQGVGESGDFTGGHGETAFRSFMTEAMSRSMAASGGVGLSNAVQREMLRMQGLE